ncbi:cation transport ATPase, ZntA domain protein [Mycobacterium xenopi 3993]|nr:cation transport ATPase, ZntA domain protein [Mycobacterium xenopi 3993]
MRGHRRGGVCCASVIADKTAAVSQAAGEYRITTDAVRG